jgi:cellobiose phosphorylase
MRIVVRNPEHVCNGVVKLLVDGQPLAGNLVPLGAAGQTYQIEVLLGNGRNDG